MSVFTPSHEQLLLNSIDHPISTNIYPAKSVTAEHVDEIGSSESNNPVSSQYTASVSDSQNEEIPADTNDVQQANAATSLRTKAKGFWLVVSPYIDPEHQLNLTTVDTGSQLFALALTNLEPATPSYAIVSYDNALNWPTVFETLKALTIEHDYKWRRAVFYVVEFRSKLRATIDNDLLFRLDKESHREATVSGGLLKYWYGKPDIERRNLATCKCLLLLHSLPEAPFTTLQS